MTSATPHLDATTFVARRRALATRDDKDELLRAAIASENTLRELFARHRDSWEVRTGPSGWRWSMLWDDDAPIGYTGAPPPSERTARRVVVVFRGTTARARN